MDDQTKRNILFVAAVSASLLLIAYSVGFTLSPVDVTQTVDGEVLAVESPSSSSQQGEAVIKLATGETVRAVVPSACVLAPGQMARLSRVDRGLLGTQGYLVRNAWDKK